MLKGTGRRGGEEAEAGRRPLDPGKSKGSAQAKSCSHVFWAMSRVLCTLKLARGLLSTSGPTGDDGGWLLRRRRCIN